MAAYKEMKGAIVGGMAIKIDFGADSQAPPSHSSSIPPTPPPSSTPPPYREEDHPRRSLYVGFPDDFPMPSEKTLEEQFLKFGKVTFVRVVPDMRCAFINFDSTADAEYAKDILVLIYTLLLHFDSSYKK